jgi:hypothetical protein
VKLEVFRAEKLFQHNRKESEPMTRLRHEMPLQSFRHMMVDSCVKSDTVPDAELLKMAGAKPTNRSWPL